MSVSAVIERISEVQENQSWTPYMRDEDRRRLRYGASACEALIIRKGIKPSHRRKYLSGYRTERLNAFIGNDHLGYRGYKSRGWPSVIKRQVEIASAIECEVLDALMEWFQSVSFGVDIPIEDAKWVVDRTGEVLSLFDGVRGQAHFCEALSGAKDAIERRIKPDKLLDWLNKELPAYMRSASGRVSTRLIAEHIVDLGIETLPKASKSSSKEAEIAYDVEIYLRTIGYEVYRVSEFGGEVELI